MRKAFASVALAGVVLTGCGGAHQHHHTIVVHHTVVTHQHVVHHVTAPKKKTSVLHKVTQKVTSKLRKH